MDNMCVSLVRLTDESCVAIKVQGTYLKYSTHTHAKQLQWQFQQFQSFATPFIKNKSLVHNSIYFCTTSTAAATFRLLPRRLTVTHSMCASIISLWNKISAPTSNWPKPSSSLGWCDKSPPTSRRPLSGVH